MSQKESASFQSLLLKSIQQGIASVVGQQTAVAVEFYVDSKVAMKDINGYTDALEKMFAAGSKIIEKRCAEALYKNLNLEFEVNENYRLNDYVEEAKRKSGSSTPKITTK